ncbi:hypothetical protein QR680_006433 [Steinernema hermaphroditum]|uniref:Uncharacterized protein n=1 Tax=Steinernema hermaphroditum TaxID=289476 RepID=A0AA39HXW6_9BILA|nr:hypothetical protein QR680_006433 [Steinernema hermaphroditum]
MSISSFNSVNDPKTEDETSRRYSLPAKPMSSQRTPLMAGTSLENTRSLPRSIEEEKEPAPSNNPYGDIPPPAYSSKPTVEVGFAEDIVYGHEKPPYPEAELPIAQLPYPEGGFPTAQPAYAKVESPIRPSSPLTAVFKVHETAIVDINDPNLCDHMTSQLTKQVNKIRKITGSIALIFMTVALAFIFMDGAKMDLMFCNFLKDNFIVGCQTVVGYSGFYILSAAIITTLILIAIVTTVFVLRGNEQVRFNLSAGNWSHKIAAFIALFIGYTLLPVSFTAKVMVYFGYFGAFIISLVQFTLLIDLSTTLYRAVKRQRPYKNRGECSKAEFILIVIVLASVSCVLGVIFTYEQCELLAYFYYVTALLSAVVFVISMIAAMSNRHSLPYYTFLATVSFAMWMSAIAFSHWPNITCNISFFPLSNSSVLLNSGKIPHINPQKFWNGDHLLALSFARSETDKAYTLVCGITVVVLTFYPFAMESVTNRFKFSNIKTKSTNLAYIEYVDHAYAFIYFHVALAGGLAAIVISFNGWVMPTNNFTGFRVNYASFGVPVVISWFILIYQAIRLIAAFC